MPVKAPSHIKAQSLKGGVPPLSKKRKPQYPPGWSPPNAVAWCAYHNTGMNYSFIRRRRCLLHRKPCKHLRWFADAINHGDTKGEPHENCHLL